MIDIEPGTVTLVGGGPGDPDLITVAGLKTIRQADVVLYDRLSPAEVLDEAPEGCVLIEVGKIPRGAFTPQEEINRLLIEHARAGRRVVRLKGGDPYVFGRGGEEWLACAEAGLPVRVVPGVSSAIAGPALAGVPVTHRTLTQGVTIVSGHVPPGDPRSQLDWAALARTRTTLVLMMGVAYLPEIVAALEAGGLDPATPAAIVVKASTPQERVLRGTLGTAAALAASDDVQPPAITVIGDVAGLDLT